MHGLKPWAWCLPCRRWTPMLQWDKRGNTKGFHTYRGECNCGMTTTAKCSEACYPDRTVDCPPQPSKAQEPKRYNFDPPIIPRTTLMDKCPRCRGFIQMTSDHIPNCLDCGWEDYAYTPPLNPPDWSPRPEEKLDYELPGEYVRRTRPGL